MAAYGQFFERMFFGVLGLLLVLTPAAWSGGEAGSPRSEAGQARIMVISNAPEPSKLYLVFF